jgi:hypothetical protein
MINKHRLTGLKGITTLFLFLTLSVSSYPLLMNNESNEGFCEPCEGSGASATAVTGSSAIRSYIVQGAGYFLDSYSSALEFMHKFELGEINGINYEELSVILDKAIEGMTNANATYTALKQLADNTPYNMAVIDALKDFNYDGFRRSNGLREDAFNRVKKFLEKGDIRGIYGENVTDTANILNLLTRIKARVDAGQFPILSDVWQLNPLYSDTQLFGQYVSQVFFKVLEK